MSKRPLYRFFAGLIAALFLASVMLTGNLLLGALIICTVMLMGMARAGPQQNSEKAHACNQNICALNSTISSGLCGGLRRWLSLFLSHIAAFFTPNKRAQDFDRYGPGIHFQSRPFNDTGQVSALNTGQPDTSQFNVYQSRPPTSRASPWYDTLRFTKILKTFADKARRHLQDAYHSVRHTLHQREPLTAGCH